MNIKETVEIPVPPLLPAETIKAIHERAKANKTYTHGKNKHDYLLSRMVFCAECGGALYAQTNHWGKQYYCHQRDRKILCNPSLWVRADMLEHAVMQLLFNIFGDVAAMERAIERAIPNPKDVENLRKQLANFEEKLESVKNERQNLVRSIAKGILTDDDAAKDMQDIRSREALLSAEINKITPQLENIPTKERIERHARTTKRVIQSIFKSHRALDKMTFEDKRELVTRVFAGKDAEGKRRGVDVRKTGNPDRPWEFTIRGIFGEYVGQWPLSRWEAEEMDEGRTNNGWHWPAPSL
jgi:hypothetical protein